MRTATAPQALDSHTVLGNLQTVFKQRMDVIPSDVARQLGLIKPIPGRDSHIPLSVYTAIQNRFGTRVPLGDIQYIGEKIIHRLGEGTPKGGYYSVATSVNYYCGIIDDLVSQFKRGEQASGGNHSAGEIAMAKHIYANSRQ